MDTVVTCKIKADGELLEPLWAGKLARVAVDLRLESADRFTLLFGDSGMVLYDLELFKPETKIVIDTDPNPTDTPLLAGEVTAATPEMVAGKPATLLVEGFDGSFRRSREKKRRSFVDVTAGDVARQVASDMGLKAEVEDGDQLEYVLQDNVSDMEFLWSLARENRFELTIDNDTLRFGPPAESGSADTTFTWGEDLLQFAPKQSAARQPSQVIVRGWNPKEKKAVIGKAGTGDEEAAVGKGDKAGDVVKAGFGDAPARVVERPVQTEQEAERLAKRLYSQYAMDFLKIQATVPGNPAVRPGRLVEIKGVGEQYEGEYYVYRAVHELSGRGYSTKLWAKRNALDAAEPEEVEAAPAEAAEDRDHWLEVRFVDSDENAVPAGDYVLAAPDGTRYTGTIGDDGTLRQDGITSGDCQIGLKIPQRLRWQSNAISPAEEATLTGLVPAAAGETVTVELFQFQREKEDQKLDTVTADVQEDDRFEVAWTPPDADQVEGWTEFVAKVKAGDQWAKSPRLVVSKRGLRDLCWSVEAARPGETVELEADTVGFPDGTEATFTIWEFDEGGEDDKIVDLDPVETKGGKARSQWRYEYTEDTDEESDKPYSPPEYYFELKSTLEGVDYQAKSNLLQFRDFIELEVVDPAGAPFAEEPYELTLPDGSKREGTLDADGKATEHDIPPGRVLVKFPRLAQATAEEGESGEEEARL